jgi:hypothetical protein
LVELLQVCLLAGVHGGGRVGGVGRRAGGDGRLRAEGASTTRSEWPVSSGGTCIERVFVRSVVQSTKPSAAFTVCHGKEREDTRAETRDARPVSILQSSPKDKSKIRRFQEGCYFNAMENTLNV